ncbi:hypothetical protein D9M70_281780 [compost metagenome]
MIAIDDPVVAARLSIQRALLGEVSAKLRAVTFSVSEICLDIRFYFDGAINYDDLESASCVETEVLADYEEEYKVTARCLRVDMPGSIEDSGVWVFRRREN